MVKLAEFKNNIDAKTDASAEVAREYAELLTSTEFGLVPRGDNLYSFRFLETLAAGAIPVIFSDDWALPFAEILNYDEFSVRIKEDDWAQLLPRLSSITPEQRCAMRQRGQEVYDRHFGTHAAQAETLLAILAKRN